MRTVVGILAGLVFVGFMIYAVMQEGRVQCEVCLEYGGNRVCRTSVAVDRKQAMREAVSSACAVLSGGVTDGIQCSATPPSEARCTE